MSVVWFQRPLMVHVEGIMSAPDRQRLGQMNPDTRGEEITNTSTQGRRFMLSVLVYSVWLARLVTTGLVTLELVIK